MQILKPLDHKLSLSRHAHSSQLLQPPSRLKPSHADTKAAVSCFQITLDLCGFRAKSHQRSCCFNFCALHLSCRTQVSRAGEVWLLVQLFLRTWTAVKRAGSRTAPDLKEGSKADLAEGKKHRPVSWLREAGQRNEPKAQRKRWQPWGWPSPAGQSPAWPRQGCSQGWDTRVSAAGSARGTMWMNDTGFWLKSACSFRLEIVPFGIVNTLFRSTVSMALSWRTEDLICSSSVLGKASAAASNLN